MIHVWINVTLGRAREQAAEETTGTPVSQGLAEIWDGLGNVPGCGLGWLSHLTQILRARETLAADAGCTAGKSVLLYCWYFRG